MQQRGITKYQGFRPSTQAIEVEVLPEPRRSVVAPSNLVQLKPEEYRALTYNKTGWLLLMGLLGVAGLLAAIGLVVGVSRPAPIVNPTCQSNCFKVF